MDQKNANTILELKKAMEASKPKEEQGGDSRYPSMFDPAVLESASLSGKMSFIKKFMNLLRDSGEQSAREFAKTVETITYLHVSQKDRLEETQIFEISKDCANKALHTAPGSVERELVLLSAINQVKTAYRSM